MLEVSPTRLRTYLECPRQYRYEKILNIRPLTFSKPLEIGKLGHKALEEYYKNHKHPALTFREEAERWKEENDAYDEDMDKDIEKVAEVLEHYPGWAADRDQFDVLNVEVPFKVTFGKGRGAFALNGRFDLVVRTKVGGALWLLDHKFVDQFMSDKEVEQNLQVKLYVLAATKIWPTEKFNGIIVNQIKKAMPKTTEPFKRVWVDLNRHQLAAAERDLNDYVRRLRNEKTWVPMPGRHCRSCRYYDLCIAEDDGTGFEEMLRAGYRIEGEEEPELVEEGVF